MDQQELRNQILSDINSERERQDIKWGIQTHPSVMYPDPENNFSLYGILSEEKSRNLNEEAFSEGRGTWSHIALEEFAESIGCTNEKDREGELIQLAAVIVAWIEDLRKR